MVKINVGTLFRDSMIWHGRYINQIDRFFNQLNNQVLGPSISFGNVICCEGNSQDNTWEILNTCAEKREYQFNVRPFKQDSAYGQVESTGNPQRVAELAKVGDAVLDRITECDYVFWCESDLIIHNKYLILSLLDGFANLDRLGIVAPLVFLENNYFYFYDTFVFRSTDDILWRNEHPWSHDFYNYDRYIPMNSVGSCALIKYDLIKNGARFQTGAFINLCYEARQMNYNIYTDKTLSIYHPNKNGYIEGRRI